MTQSGTLYLVATPIGNLEDISLRAIATLKAVNYIAAEDTRHSKRLLQHYQITTPLFALHAHNEQSKAEQLIERLQQGESLAVISDAGTPLISDPGWHMVACAKQAGIKVVSIPGACAAISAVISSGLPTDQFTFVGFLSNKAGQRQQQLQALHDSPRTLIIYEAPHRLIALLQDIVSVFGEAREVSVARELTKQYEHVITDRVANILKLFATEQEPVRGEMVVMIKGQTSTTTSDEHAIASLLSILLPEVSLKTAVDLTVKLTRANRNEIYQRALRLKPQ